MSSDRYGPLVEQQARREATDAADNVDRYRDVDPEAMAKALRASGKIDADPLSVAVEDPTLPDALDQRYSTENTLLQESSVELRSWLQDPENAALAHDDIENLGWLQRAAKRAKSDLDLTATAIATGRTPEQLATEGYENATAFGTGLKRGVLMTQQVGRGVQALGTAFALRGYMDRVSRLERLDAALEGSGGTPLSQMQVAEVLGIEPTDKAGMVEAGLLSAYTALQPEDRQRFAMQQVEGILEDQKAIEEFGKLIAEYESQKPPAEEFNRRNFLNWAVSTGAEALPLMVLMLGATTAGSVAGPGGAATALLTTGALSGGGEMTVEHLLSGGDILDPEFQSRIVPGMLLYGASEFVGVAGRYARPLFGIDDALLRRATLNWARSAGKAVAANSAEEFVNEFLQSLISEHVRTGSFDWTEEGIKSKLMEGLAGAVVGAQFSMVTEVPGVVAESRDRAKAVSSGEEVAAIQDLNEAAASSKTRKRSPEKFRELLQKSGMDRTYLYIDADRIKAAIDSNQISAEDAGLHPDQVEVYAARGARVPVRTDHFMTKIAGTPAAQLFLDHGTLSPDGYSRSELDVFNRGQAAILKSVEESVAQSQDLLERRREIERDIYQQLREAGQGHTLASSNAALHAAFVTTMSNVYGEDISGSFGLTVAGPHGAGALTEPSFADNPPLIPPYISRPEAPTLAADLSRQASLLSTTAITGSPDVSGAIAPTRPQMPVPGRRLAQPSIKLISDPPVIVPADGKRLKLTDVARELVDRHMETYGRKLDPTTSDEDYTTVYDSLLEEVNLQLESIDSGKGWYSHDTDLAISDTAKVYEKVATPDGRAMWLMLAAVMSNNSDPVRAWQAVEPAFKAWSQTGTLFRTREEAAKAVGDEVVMSTFKDKGGKSVTRPAGWTQRNSSVMQGIDILNYLIQREGSPVAAADWLSGTHSPQEINNVMAAAGLKTPRFNKGEVANLPPQPGYLALGPKIGNYFNTLFQTGDGADTPVIDMWLTRTYRRLTGGLFDGPLDAKSGIVGGPSSANGDAERKTIARLTSDLSKETGLPVEDVQAILWFYEQKLYRSLGIKSRSGSNSDGAAALLKKYNIAPSTDEHGGGAAQDLGTSGAQEQGAGGEGEPSAVNEVPVVSGASGPVTADDLQNLGPDFFKRPGWAIVTADQENLHDSIRESRNAENRELLRADLESRGIPYREVTGHYGSPEPENSFVIIADEDTAAELGRKYQQDSVLTPSGLLYTTRPRPNTPIDTAGFREGQDAIDQGYYSITEDGYAFAVGLDFDKGPGRAVFPEGTSEAEERPQLPVDDRDGLVRLYHWSNRRLDLVDPDFAGSGPLTSDFRRSGEAASYYGINPREDARDPGTGYVKEGGLGPYKHVAKVNPADLYPYFEDPDALKPPYEPVPDRPGVYRKPDGSMVTEAEMSSDYEQAIKDAGYIGYYVTDNGKGSAPLGNVAKVWAPLKVKLAEGRSYDQSAVTSGNVPEGTIINDDTMQPELFYHGTHGESQKLAADGSFSPEAGREVFWSNRKALAVEHAMMHRAKGPKVVQATLAFDNPLQIGPVDGTPDAYWMQNTTAIRDQVRAGEHDGVLIYTSDGDAMAISYSPEQITERDRDFTQPSWGGTLVPKSNALKQAGDGESSGEVRGQILIPESGVEGATSAITLFRLTDPSTFVHESAHWYLEVFSALARKTEAPEQMKADLEKIHAWMRDLGIEVFSADGTYTTEAHEAWATAAEQYVMEGRAPSSYLKQAFARLARWMVSLYREAVRSDIEVTPELREVLDRMLATEEEIAATKNELGDQALFADAPPGMTAQEWETYKRVAERANNEAQARVLSKVMDDIAKRDRKARAAAKRRFREEAKRELSDDQIYRYIEDSKDRGLTIDTSKLEALVGSDRMGEFSGATHRRKLHVKGGADPRLVAELYGFKRVSDFLEALSSAMPKAWAIDRLVDQKMEEEFGPPLSEEELRAEATLAIKNAEANERVAREIEALERGTGVEGLERWRKQNAAAKAEAERLIGGTPVREILKFRQYLRESRKAAREAQAALAKVVRNAEGRPTPGSEKFLQEAAEAKRRQLLADHMFSIAADIAQKIERGRAMAARMDVKKVRQNIGEPFIGTIDSLLEQYDLRKSVTNKEIKNRLSVRELMQEMVDQNRHGELNIDPRIIMEARKRHYTELSSDEAVALFEAIESIAHAGRQATKAKVAGEKQALRSVVARIALQMDKYMKSVDLPREADRRSRLGKGFRRSVQWLKNADTLLLELDGGEHQGFAYRAIKKAIDEAAARNQERREAALKDLATIYRSHYTNRELRAMATDLKAYPELGGVELTKKGLLAMALNAGNEGNWQRLTSLETAHGSYRPKAVEKVLLENLTENDWAFVQEIWDYINHFWPEIAEQEYRLTGVRPKKVDAVLQIEGAPDFVTGGYFPIRYDRDISSMSNAQKASEDAMDGFGGRYGKAQTRNGHTKERLTSVTEPLELDLGIIENHILGVIYDLEFREPLLNAWKIVTDREFADKMLEKGRAEALEALELWLQDTAAGDHTSAHGLFESGLRYMRNTFTISRLGLSFRTALIQPLGLAQSVSLLGPSTIAHGLKAYTTSAPSWLQFARDNSPTMRERQRTMERDMNHVTGQLQRNTMSGGRFRSFANMAVPVFMFMMQKSQYYVADMVTWVAAYEKKAAEGAGQKDAIAYADWAVRRAQGSGLMSDRSMLERGTTSRAVRRTELPKLFTVLSSYFFAKLNVLMERNAALGREHTVTAAFKYAGDLFMLFALEAAFMSLFYINWDDDDDLEDITKDFMINWASQTASSVTSMFPIIRDVDSALRGFDGGVYNSYVNLANDAVRVASDLAAEAGMSEGDGFDLQTLKALSNLGSLFFLPSVQINRLLRGTFEDDLSVRNVSPARMVSDSLGVTQVPRN